MIRVEDRASRFLRIVNRVEDSILLGLFTGMIGFAIGQIILRNFFGTGISWADPLLRILVLWVGLAGAMVATRLDNHIAINVFSRYLPPRARHGARALVDVFTAGVCALIAWHAARFVALERSYGTIAFGQVPSWVTELILPLAFAVIALRYSVLALRHGRDLFAAGPPA
jgi:TRAP-type C4-dicarboxylate transport system permease small subunit